MKEYSQEVIDLVLDIYADDDRPNNAIARTVSDKYNVLVKPNDITKIVVASGQALRDSVRRTATVRNYSKLMNNGSPIGSKAPMKLGKYAHLAK